MNVQSVANGRLAGNRRVFVWAYGGLGGLSAFVYLSRMDLSFVTITSPWFGLGEAVMALPAMLPYVVSGIYAYELISERRLGLYLLLVAVAVGTTVASLAMTGTFGVGMGVGMSVVEMAFWYVVGQTAAYGLAAEFLLRIEWP